MLKLNGILLLIGLIQISFSWVPKIVWTFWNKPFEQDDHILQALHRHHKMTLEPKGWEIRHLNS